MRICRVLDNEKLKRVMKQFSLWKTRQRVNEYAALQGLVRESQGVLPHKTITLLTSSAIAVQYLFKRLQTFSISAFLLKAFSYVSCVGKRANSITLSIQDNSKAELHINLCAI